MPKMFGCLNLSHYGFWKLLAFPHVLSVEDSSVTVRSSRGYFTSAHRAMFVFKDLSCSDLTNRMSGQDVRV